MGGVESGEFLWLLLSSVRGQTRWWGVCRRYSVQDERRAGHAVEVEGGVRGRVSGRDGLVGWVSRLVGPGSGSAAAEGRRQVSPHRPLIERTTPQIHAVAELKVLRNVTCCRGKTGRGWKDQQLCALSKIRRSIIIRVFCLFVIPCARHRRQVGVRSEPPHGRRGSARPGGGSGARASRRV